MNHTQTWMHRALRVLALLGLVSMGGAWGQTTAVPTARQLRTAQGCIAIILSRFTITNLSWDGACKEGLINGIGVLTYEYTRNTGSVISEARLTLADKGTPSGVSFDFASGNGNTGMLTYRTGSGYSSFAIEADRNDRYGSSAFLDEKLKDAFGTFAQLNSPTFSESDLRKLISAYQSSDVPSFDHGVAFLKTQLSQRNRRDVSMGQPDDPKVFGRSARSQ